jgi:hypothetical protein
MPELVLQMAESVLLNCFDSPIGSSSNPIQNGNVTFRDELRLSLKLSS